MTVLSNVLITNIHNDMYIQVLNKRYSKKNKDTNLIMFYAVYIVSIFNFLTTRTHLPKLIKSNDILICDEMIKVFLINLIFQHRLEFR